MCFTLYLQHLHSSMASVNANSQKWQTKSCWIFLTERSFFLIWLLHCNFLLKLLFLLNIFLKASRRAYSRYTKTPVWCLPPPLLFLFLLSFLWHFLWWALRKNSYCFSCQFCFVSSECWVLLCHFQGLFQSLEHSWCFNQELTPWRSWQLIPNQLCGRYLTYFTAHSGIPFSFHRWGDCFTQEFFYTKILIMSHSPQGCEHVGFEPQWPQLVRLMWLTNSVKEAFSCLGLWFC